MSFSLPIVSQCVDVLACVVSGLLMLLKALSCTTCRSFNACTYAALGWVCGSATVLIEGLESFKHVLKRNSAISPLPLSLHYIIYSCTDWSRRARFASDHGTYVFKNSVVESGIECTKCKR